MNRLGVFKTGLRCARVRGVVLLLVMFMSYLVASKPAVAAGNAGVMTIAASAHSHNVDPGSASSRSDSQPGAPDDDLGDDGDCAETDVETDEFLLIATRFDFGESYASFATQDAALSLPAFDRGVDYPPEA